jgi:ketosteroid isomerase-like protein
MHGTPKRMMTRVVMIITFLLSSPLMAIEFVGGSEEDRQKLAQISKSWAEDYISGNVDGLMSIMHEEAMVMAQKQATVSGKEAIRAYFSARAGQPGVTFTDNLQEIRFNGSWAYVLGDFLLEVAPWEEGKPGFKRHGRYFVLYEQNEAGEWKMLRDMDNDMPAE